MRVRVCSIPRRHYISGGLDVTRKTGVGLGAKFAPTWEMIMGHKSGAIDDAEYAERYFEILDMLPEQAFEDLHQYGLEQGGRLVLQCYCASGKFCHTILLIQYLRQKHGDKFCIT